MVRRNVFRSLQRLWVAVGLVLLTLVLLGSLASRVPAIYERRSRADLIRLLANRAYPGEQWVGEYFHELWRVRAAWHSYVYWRGKPFRGKFINIDENGLRHTWRASPVPSQGSVRIFMFGGSGMWGVGARDDFTIPSLVSKKLHSAGMRDAWVVNFGEIGYVSTQEVIALMLELQRGNLPDIVVFLDSYNDALSALESGTAGLPMHEENRIAEFNLRQRLNWRGYVEGRALFKLIRRIAGAQRMRAEADPDLPKRVVDVYLANTRTVQILADRFGFAALFFWQPGVHDKNSPTPLEEKLRRQREDMFALEVDKALERALQSGRDHVEIRDLARVFDDDQGTLFIDQVHVSEKGMEKLAEAIFSAIAQAYKSKRVPTPR